MTECLNIWRHVCIRPNQYLGRRELHDVWKYTTYKCRGNQCISKLYLSPKRGWNFEFGSCREQRATGTLEDLKASKLLSSSKSQKAVVQTLQWQSQCLWASEIPANTLLQKRSLFWRTARETGFKLSRKEHQAWESQKVQMTPRGVDLRKLP